jgi:hypothetical protein
MLFKEVIFLYSENHTKPINKNTELQIAKIGGIYNYRLHLKRY